MVVSSDEECFVVLFKRSDGQFYLAVREFDAKFISEEIETQRTADAGEVKCAKNRQQSHRANIRQAIVSMKLSMEAANKSEIQFLKSCGALGSRAPSCSLLSHDDMLELLESFGKRAAAARLRVALCNVPDITEAGFLHLPAVNPSSLPQDTEPARRRPLHKKSVYERPTQRVHGQFCAAGGPGSILKDTLNSDKYREEEAVTPPHPGTVATRRGNKKRKKNATLVLDIAQKNVRRLAYSPASRQEQYYSPQYTYSIPPPPAPCTLSNCECQQSSYYAPQYASVYPPLYATGYAPPDPANSPGYSPAPSHEYPQCAPNYPPPPYITPDSTYPPNYPPYYTLEPPTATNENTENNETAFTKPDKTPTNNTVRGRDQLLPQALDSTNEAEEQFTLAKMLAKPKPIILPNFKATPFSPTEPLFALNMTRIDQGDASFVFESCVSTPGLSEGTNITFAVYTPKSISTDQLLEGWDAIST